MTSTEWLMNHDQAGILWLNDTHTFSSSSFLRKELIGPGDVSDRLANCFFFLRDGHKAIDARVIVLMPCQKGHGQ